MSLALWQAKGWLRKCPADQETVQQLLQDAEADLKDARREMPPAWTFSLAATASFNLCAALLVYFGYDTDKDRHLKAIRALPFIMGENYQDKADYLETCLKMRSAKAADSEVTITPRQALSLLKFSEDFYLETIEWLRSSNSLLVANSDVSFIRPPEDGLLL
jgi:hypothetical protein